MCPEGSQPCGGRQVRSPCHAGGVTAARRRPEADDPEQDRPTQADGLGAVAAWRPEGRTGGGNHQVIRATNKFNELQLT